MSLLRLYSFVSLYCFAFVLSSPILIDELSPSIVGVEVEDRIANPSPAPADADAEKPVDDGKAKPASLISIDGILSPDVTSVDVNDERRAHTEEGREEDRTKDRCVGSGCDCPPGFEGVEPFCRPVASAGEVAPTSRGIELLEDVEIPIAFYQKIAGVKNFEEFVNVTKIYNGWDVVPVPSTTLPGEGCLPKKKCVSVRPKHRHPSEDVFPSSIDVERCGGCCGHPELACLPWSTEPMTVNLLKYRYNPDNTISNLGFTTTSVIRELKCKCVKVQT